MSTSLNMYLALVGFYLGFEKFKTDDFAEWKLEILLKCPVKTEGDVFVWTLCMNTLMPNILSLYKFSELVGLESSFVWSNFVLLWIILIACFC